MPPDSALLAIPDGAALTGGRLISVPQFVLYRLFRQDAIFTGNCLTIHRKLVS
ncbi:MAG TPA: hypothetical protein DEB17_07525 [Chlorobaculum sp.]|uniref:Uncharacterized protein n=1 Tax=Chlorobaculum tepidum (strain ATCC 49652 / DSM 12025 / NBRC 103806 / TLS) TaxID=194439 RepID=Q8KFH7_CHLTE|nr:hypothetical protein CT0349 [Chlorobaculum tepidum TLS]HBU23822.1 hypothetical protein [Chlorobaculum sp.]